jgi:FAD/FMN-containing dehydrogenase
MNAIAPTQELLDADRAWARGFYDRLRPHALSAGSYVNFMTEFDDDRVQATFGATKYARLAHIKATYDPDNVFHHDANIRPEPGAVTSLSDVPREPHARVWGSAARD